MTKMFSPKALLHNFFPKMIAVPSAYLSCRLSFFKTSEGHDPIIYSIVAVSFSALQLVNCACAEYVGI
jgi:hypothetical protein